MTGDIRTAKLFEPSGGVPCQTWTRQIIDLSSSFPVDYRDIVNPLASQVRYNGQIMTAHDDEGMEQAGYTVAAHSMLVASLVDVRYKPHALLHDAHEAYLGDIIAPVWQLLCRECELDREKVDELVHGIDEMIWSAFGLAPTLSADAYKAIRTADMLALHYERTYFLGDDWTEFEGHGFSEFQCWPNMEAFYDLDPGGGKPPMKLDRLPWYRASRGEIARGFEHELRKACPKMPTWDNE